MSLPKEFQKFSNYPKIIHSGNTVIKIDPSTDIINITHTGSNGDSIYDIQDNVDKCLGDGRFEELEESCKYVIDAGSPDYYYIRTMWFK